MSQQLAELLVKDKVITATQFQEAATGLTTGKGYIRTLIDKKIVAETKLLFYLSQKFGLTTINLAKFDLGADIIQLMSADLVNRFQAIPIKVNENTLVVAIWDPTRMADIENLKIQIKRSVEFILTSVTAFDSVREKYYGQVASAQLGSAIEHFKKNEAKKARDEPTSQTSGIEINLDQAQVHEIDLSKSASDAPVISLVNAILSESIRRGASDIHVEPYEKRFRVRMRVDGVLFESAQVPMEMRRAAIARLKIMARLDISESRIPQDGRIKLKMGSQEIDFRVNTMPTLFGEKVVLRILNKGSLNLDMEKLGFETQQLEVFKKGILSPNGMVLVTGPTGSGKTTTLYSAISELNQITDNISTAEDPVEYNLEGVNQVQVNKEIGLTFPAVLRAILRQDPDTVLVGEIRDYETAEVAIQAALTGHLVLSTLHTNDAASSVIRLTNMGIEPFLVVASVNTIVAQRLIRTICTQCRVERPVPKEKLIQLGFSPGSVERMVIYAGKGCPVCNGSGYKGRVAIYEVLDFSPALKEMVLRGESVAELKKQAAAEGMKSLRMSALTKVALGVTTLEEALSLTMEG